jgi:hypothetical protein
MERKFNFNIDEHYHIYSRGVEKRQIFFDNNDKDCFIRLFFYQTQINLINLVM